MTQVAVPIRYPLTDHSRATLAKAAEIVDDQGGSLTVIHVSLYHDTHRPSRADLKRAVEAEFDDLPPARYVVRRGLLVEETLLDEIASERPDVVVIGRKQTSRWRRMIRRLVDDPDIEDFLRNELDCEVVTAPAA